MSNRVEVVFWDVQHGSATYIKTPNNRHIVVDLGTGKYSHANTNTTFSPLQYLKNAYNVSQLDYVVITHPHRDHLDDIYNFSSLAPKVLCRPRGLSSDAILKGGRSDDKDKLDKYMEISKSYSMDISEQSYDNPRNPDNWGGLNISTFRATGCNQNNINNFIDNNLDYLVKPLKYRHFHKNDG